MNMRHIYMDVAYIMIMRDSAISVCVTYIQANFLFDHVIE